MSSLERVIAVSASTPTVRWTGIAALITPEPWVQDALCAETDPEIFHPPKGGDTSSAKDVCRRCDVIEECLAYALRTEEKRGIWGGKSPQERRAILKKRAAA